MSLTCLKKNELTDKVFNWNITMFMTIKQPCLPYTSFSEKVLIEKKYSVLNYGKWILIKILHVEYFSSLMSQIFGKVEIFRIKVQMLSTLMHTILWVDINVEMSVFGMILGFALWCGSTV